MAERVRQINQLHPPLPKKKCVDDKGNRKCTVYAKVKDGKSTATISLAEFNATNKGTALTNAIGEFVDKMNGKILCDFLVR